MKITAKTPKIHRQKTMPRTGTFLGGGGGRHSNFFSMVNLSPIRATISLKVGFLSPKTLSENFKKYPKSLKKSRKLLF